MTHVTCRLTAKNFDQLRNPTLDIIEYGLPLLFCIGTRNRALDGGARWHHLLGAMDKYLRYGGDAAVVTITAALVFVFIPLQQFRFLYRCSVDDCRVLQGFYTPCVVIRKLNI